jgi:KaiC/GvpD/RAD55 family RecA-like ATPase
MPTVSAAQALQSLQSSTPRAISTGIASLDAALQDPVQSSIHSITAKGVSRGHVTEVYGPPGVGKTSFGWVLIQQYGCQKLMSIRMQLTVNALKSGEKVVWIGKC